jgi:putative ABC transport system substrate-binding protein
MRYNKNSRNRNTGALLILAGMILVILLLGGCGSKPRVYHVGILSGLDFFASTTDGFKTKMTELGYRESKNIVYDIQKTQFNPPAEKSILKKFVADKVDLILTFPTEVSLEAKAAVEGTKIPLVFANANIEGVDLVKSITAPGGNITGVRYPGPDLAIKRFEILHELAPAARRIWIFYQRGYPIVASQLEVLQPAAVSAGVVLIEKAADDAAEIQAILQKQLEAKDIGIDAILIIAEPLSVTPDAYEVLGKFTAEHKIPVGGALMLLGNYESLFGVSTENVAVGRQAAVLADKIFKGVPAGTIMVASADSYLQINYRAALKLGLKVSESLLSLANEIIR